MRKLASKLWIGAAIRNGTSVQGSERMMGDMESVKSTLKMVRKINPTTSTEKLL